MSLLTKQDLSFETLENYRQKVVDLLKPSIRDSGPDGRLRYLVCKIQSEWGEVLGELCKKYYHGKDVADSKFVDELGDVLWYWFNLASLLTEENKNKLFGIFSAPVRGVKNDDGLFLATLYGNIEIGKLSELWIQFNDSEEDYKTLGFSLFNLGFSILQICSIFNFKVEDILNANLDKLNKRHGTKYNPEFYAPKQEIGSV